MPSHIHVDVHKRSCSFFLSPGKIRAEQRTLEQLQQLRAKLAVQLEAAALAAGRRGKPIYTHTTNVCIRKQMQHELTYICETTLLPDKRPMPFL